MLVSGEWFNEINIIDFSLIEKKINSMNVKNRSYMCMSDMNVDYIQIGGYADRFTVEVRIYSSCDIFTHYKADTSLIDTIDNDFVLIGGQNVTVRNTQVLQGKTAIILFHSFFSGEKLNSIVYWKNMTDMFM